MKPSMFIKIDGIDGESEDSDHEKWIDILSWAWGGALPTSAHVGSGRSSSQPRTDDLTFVKFLDRSSPALFHSLFVGKHIPKVEMHCTKSTGNDKGGDLKYIIMKLTDVIISSVTTGGSSGEDRLTENVSLNFAKIEYQYTVQGDDGGAGDKPMMVWEVTKGQGSIS